MSRLEASERRFEQAVSRVAAALATLKKAREDARLGLSLAEGIEQQAEEALKSVRDLIRQQEGS